MRNASTSARVEVSALFELGMSVTAIGAHGAWNGTRWESEAVRWVRQSEVLRLLCPRGGSPSRLLLPSGEGSVDLHDDLARLAATDSTEVDEVLGAARPGSALSELRLAAREPRQVLASLIREVADYSSEVFARHWPLLRSQLLTTAVPKLCEPADSARLIPSAFTGAVRHLDHEHGRVVVFPVSRPAAGFEVPTQFRRWQQPLADLVGARRAVMLLVLEDAASTDEVAAAMHLSGPAASHHLKVLRRAGLVERTSTRRGSWRRTDVGTRLVRSATSSRQAG